MILLLSVIKYIYTTSKDMKKKKRNAYSVIEFDNPVQADSIRYKNGMYEVMHEGKVVSPDRGQVQISYERPKGSKILNRTPTEGSISLDPNMQLTEYYQLVAVDTNTKKLGGSTISMASIFIGRADKVSDNSINITIRPCVLYEYRGLTPENAERYVWRKLLHDLTNEEKLKSKKIGIVVDSSLSKLREINERVLPVYEDYYLPDGYTLIYASSDAGMEYAANKMIRQCDRLANKKYNLIMNDLDHKEGTHLELDEWDTQFIMWY